MKMELCKKTSHLLKTLNVRLIRLGKIHPFKSKWIQMLFEGWCRNCKGLPFDHVYISKQNIINTCGKKMRSLKTQNILSLLNSWKQVMWVSYLKLD
jgi:hypothetical protein